MHIKFFTGPHCSLCDDAKRLLDDLDETIRPSVEMLNIRDNTEHYHLYATRIPVLKREDNQAELGWPFDSTQLKAFLQ